MSKAKWCVLFGLYGVLCALEFLSQKGRERIAELLWPQEKEQP